MRCLAQGHLDTSTLGGAGDRTSNHLRLPPEPHAAHNQTFFRNKKKGFLQGATHRITHSTHTKGTSKVCRTCVRTIRRSGNHQRSFSQDASDEVSV